jgi:hypothetical protein
VTHFGEYIIKSLLHAMQNLGYKTIKDLHNGIYDGTLAFEARSPSAQGKGLSMIYIHILYLMLHCFTLMIEKDDNF